MFASGPSRVQSDSAGRVGDDEFAKRSFVQPKACRGPYSLAKPRGSANARFRRHFGAPVRLGDGSRGGRPSLRTRRSASRCVAPAAVRYRADVACGRPQTAGGERARQRRDGAREAERVSRRRSQTARQPAVAANEAFPGVHAQQAVGPGAGGHDGTGSDAGAGADGWRIHADDRDSRLRQRENRAGDQGCDLRRGVQQCGGAEEDAPGGLPGSPGVPAGRRASRVFGNDAAVHQQAGTAGAGARPFARSRQKNRLPVCKFVGLDRSRFGSGGRSHTGGYQATPRVHDMAEPRGGSRGREVPQGA